MSRAERRAYKRMTKNQDPYSLPGGAQQRLKAQQQRKVRRAARRTEFTFWSSRALAWILGGAFVAGLIGFSVAWPNGMPLALYVGVAVAIVWAALGWVVRSVQARAAANR